MTTTECIFLAAGFIFCVLMLKDGREYLFHESAVKVDLNRPVTGSLLKRIRNGKKAKS